MGGFVMMIYVIALALGLFAFAHTAKGKKFFDIKD